MFKEYPDAEPKLELTFEEILDRWVKREGDKYLPILMDRGFLAPGEKNDPQKIYEAAREWRRAATEGLSLEGKIWRREKVTDVSSILDWKLGGWRGWMPYRPTGALVTTFRDVVAGLEDLSKENLPPDHRICIPEIAENISRSGQIKDIFVLCCESDTSVLDGTHTLAGLAYAVAHQMQTPSYFWTYACHFLPSEKDIFESFCHEKPVKYGKYWKPPGEAR